MWGWITLGIIGAVIAVAWAQARAARGTYRTLSSRQPARRPRLDKPLGMEATDLEHVARAARRNEALERGHVNWTRGAKGSFAAAAETDIEPGPEDQRYAAWFHRSFMRGKDRT